MTIAAKPDYPVVSWMLEGVADFMLSQRRKRASLRELDDLAPADVAAIARDLSLSTTALRELTGQDEGTPVLLTRMLAALNKTMPPSADPQSRDMEMVCSLCLSKRRCSRELSHGSAAANYGKFCPNAYNLDALPRQERLAAS